MYLNMRLVKWRRMREVLFVRRGYVRKHEKSKTNLKDISLVGTFLTFR